MPHPDAAAWASPIPLEAGGQRTAGDTRPAPAPPAQLESRGQLAARKAVSPAPHAPYTHPIAR